MAERPPRRSAHRYPYAENNTGGRMNGRTSRKSTLPREHYGFRVRRKSDHGIGSDAERGVRCKGDIEGNGEARGVPSSDGGMEGTCGYTGFATLCAVAGDVIDIGELPLDKPNRQGDERSRSDWGSVERITTAAMDVSMYHGRALGRWLYPTTYPCVQPYRRVVGRVIHCRQNPSVMS